MCGWVLPVHVHARSVDETAGLLYPVGLQAEHDRKVSVRVREREGGLENVGLT